MAYYIKAGQIPPTRHTQFRKPDGSLYQEELFSTEGFSNIYSLLYHLYPPTRIKQVGEPFSVAPKVVMSKHLQPRSFKGFKIQPEDDYLKSRKTLLVNNDLHISLAAPRKSMTDYFYKNADADEVIFIHEGSGKLLTEFGEIAFEYGDYVVVPRGIVYQIQFNDEKNRLLIIESFSPVTFPSHYQNKVGQLLEHAPFCERDIKTPQNLITHDEKGDFFFLIKKQGVMYPYHYANHPFDLIGWDGYMYPYAFSIHNFQPITGRVHLPPPIHQTFAARNMVICSFVPRMYDYHPLSIPAPYHHSNIDSDELLYYVDGDFMSRKSVERGQITLHPGGVPHGPHPGTYEASVGKKETHELAVMIDPFNPLQLTEEALGIEEKDYYLSWLEE
ncbi:MAG: homogentisate 1,2-dioxygenase [Bacteroidetes bacterium]|nr:homogentisate 1,2-dioxygenase [Bacteroidota bacterium]